MNNEEFIKLAIVKYGESLYDYTELRSTKNKNRIAIRCNKHNLVFETQQHRHLYKNAICPECRLDNKTEEFIERSKLIHGDNKYSYDRTIFKHVKEVVEIYCNDCKKYFKQTPNTHVNNKSGCRGCGVIVAANIKRQTTEQFIERSRSRYGDRYDYSKTIFTDSHDPVIVHCKKCGIDLELSASNHLRGEGGCTLCGIESSKLKQLKTTEQFIEEVTIVHGPGKYGYDKVKYKGVFKKVKIFCNVHRKYFKQKATTHLGGAGCPTCRESSGERLTAKILDSLNVEYIREFKIRDDIHYEYDFFIPTHNVYIEYHGIQHYQYTEFFHKTEDGFESYKERDRNKVNLIISQFGRLIEIPYTIEKEEDIRSLLVKKLVGAKVLSPCGTKVNRLIL